MKEGIDFDIKTFFIPYEKLSEEEINFLISELQCELRMRRGVFG